MPAFRVPYPSDPERRRALFEQALAKLARFGRCEGTPEAGTFSGSTPVGGVAGSYRVVEETGELEVDITKKPIFVPMSVIESEARKFSTLA